MDDALDLEQLEQVRKLGTCAVSNAIETFNVRIRSEGFSKGPVRCIYELLGPMIGYAATGRIRSADPPVGGSGFVEHMEWWRYVQTLPLPRIVVLQDTDPSPGVGSFWDHVQVNVHLALGCVGTITDGAVRDVDKVAATGFHYFAGSTSVSPAYIHLIDFGAPVEVGGLEIKHGDLIHADCNGVLSIPKQIAGRIPEAAQMILDQQQQVIDLCRSPGFSIENLHAKSLELGYSIAGPGLHHRRG